MTSEQQPKQPVPPNLSGDPRIAIGGDVVDSVVIAGDHNTVNQTVIKRISNFFAGDSEQQRARRNRQAMLELVKNTWVKGVLEKSLHHKALIQLNLQERPRAVEHPWDMQLQMPGREEPYPIPAGTSITRVFDDMKGSLLILGEPGSGKTTMLLELARACIDRALADENASIPVVFNLSSWGPGKTLDEWLLDECKSKYYVARKIAEAWLSRDELHLLLDGLDEVRQEHRAACIEAINDFRQRHGLTTPIVVCSRTADYEALSAKLRLSGAVMLQPLTPRQIEDYFKQAGSALDGVLQVLHQDDDLRELARQPLLLSIMTMAYQGMSTTSIASDKAQTVETRRTHLFDTYIEQMFGRLARTKNDFYGSEQIKRWLAWLAQSMIQHAATPFMFENMQPNWLERKYQSTYWLVTGLSLGMFYALIMGPFFGWIMGLTYGPVRGLLYGIGLGLFCVVMMLMVALGGRSLKGNRLATIEMVDAVVWAWKDARKGLVVVGLVGGLTGVLLGFSIGDWQAGLPLGLVGGLLGAIASGLKPQQIAQTTFPGQRISLSIRSYRSVFLLFFLLFGPSGALAIGLFLHRLAILTEEPTARLIFGWQIGLVGGLITGLVLGLVVGILYGMLPILQHYALRFAIARQGLFPWNISHFLNDCVERIFLHRVGGGYIFIHRLLMEHFAAMYAAKK